MADVIDLYKCDVRSCMLKQWAGCSEQMCVPPCSFPAWQRFSRFPVLVRVACNFASDMEVDHVPYIFGSFSRRRQAEDVMAPKRRSLDPTPAVSQRRSGRYERSDTCFMLFHHVFMAVPWLRPLVSGLTEARVRSRFCPCGICGGQRWYRNVQNTKQVRKLHTATFSSLKPHANLLTVLLS